ncbi:hypothetical protein [Cotesia plutellae polydnavirus]|nr:hypothetical protein [Cotesia plutellae polydnavirus]
MILSQPAGTPDRYCYIGMKPIYGFSRSLDFPKFISRCLFSMYHNNSLTLSFNVNRSYYIVYLFYLQVGNKVFLLHNIYNKRTTWKDCMVKFSNYSNVYNRVSSLSSRYFWLSPISPNTYM